MSRRDADRFSCARTRRAIAIASRTQRVLRRCGFFACVATCSLGAGAIEAAEINTGNSELKLRWDNTVKYTLALRARSPSGSLIDAPPATVNQDDGDRNLRHGVISNRMDLFSEADIVYRRFGARISAAGWYDTVYNRTNSNDSPATANSWSVPFNQFTEATRTLHGRNIELLDAFVFVSGTSHEMGWSMRAGRHAIVWGESVFFGTNGIAAAQSPIDVVKLQSVPNSLFKETVRPVGQVSGQLQFSPAISAAAYYQWEWERSRLPAAGSYFSASDVLDAGGERLLVGGPAVTGGPAAAFFRGNDLAAKNSSQGGVALRLHARSVDIGLYAVQYHSKLPFLYVQPSVVTSGGQTIVLDPTNYNPAQAKVGQYYLVFPEGIRAFGASAAAAVGEATIAGEVSVRRNMPLVSVGLVTLPGSPADNKHNPLYATGNSVHAQGSILWLMGPTFIARSATVLGEAAFNRRTSITRNPQTLDSNTTRDALAMRLVYEPEYRQALPGWDTTVPFGIGYGVLGRSSVIPNFAVRRGGDLTVGVTANYLETWRASLVYTHYFGVAGTATDAGGHFTYAQSLHDRDFVSFSVRITF